MNDTQPFIDTIINDPNADGPKLVLADWLEEQGDPRAKWIRWWLGPLTTAAKTAITNAKPKTNFSFTTKDLPHDQLLGSLIIDLSWRHIIMPNNKTLAETADHHINITNTAAILRWLNLINQQQITTITEHTTKILEKTITAKDNATMKWHQAASEWHHTHNHTTKLNNAIAAKDHATATWHQTTTIWHQAIAARDQIDAPWHQVAATMNHIEAAMKQADAEWHQLAATTNQIKAPAATLNQTTITGTKIHGQITAIYKTAKNLAKKTKLTDPRKTH